MIISIFGNRFWLEVFSCNKEPYEAPSVSVVEVKVEGIVCGSPSTEDYHYGNLNEP